MARKLKRGIASLLVAVMLVSMLPAALAADVDGENISSQQVRDSSETWGELYYFQSIASPELTAVPDENGVYALVLQQGTQFPCEIFLYDPAIEDEDEAYFSVSFDNDTDSVEVGGRTFLPRVSEEPAPEDSEAAWYSKLPLKEYTFSVDLSKYVGDELKAVPLTDLLTEPANGDKDAVPHYTANKTVAWGLDNSSDRFTVEKGVETIDLSEFTGRTSIGLVFIVGSGDQLDPDNICCIVNATLIDPETLLDFTVTAGESALSINDRYTDSYRDPETREWKTVYELRTALSFWDTEDVRLRLNTRADKPEVTENLAADVYAGYFETEEDAVAANAQKITDEIWGGSAQGYKANYSVSTLTQAPMFTVVFKRGDSAVYTMPFGVSIPSTNPYNLLDFKVYHSDEQIPTNGFYYYEYFGQYEASIAVPNLEKAAEASLVMAFKSGNPDSAGVTATVKASGTDITSDVWQAAGSSAPKGYSGDYTNDQTPIQFQVTLQKGEKTRTLEFKVCVYASGISVYSYSTYLYQDNNSIRNRATYSHDGPEYDEDDWNRKVYSYEMRSSNYPVTGTYYLNLHLYNGDPSANNSNNGIAFVTRAVLGDYATEAAINGQSDIKEKLFETTSSNTAGTGYAADFSEGDVTFTILDTEGGIHHITIHLEANSYVPSAGTYLHMYGATDGTTSYAAYPVQSSDDSYYSRGYQTIFLLNRADKSPVNVTKIKPLFYANNGATIYLGHNESSGQVQRSGVDEVDFTPGVALKYSAAAEDKTHLDNYQVTFLTQQEGAKLFVNAVSNSEHKDASGTPLREVKLTRPTEYHDILFANIGKEELTGLSVTLTDNPLIKLDEYWTINSDSTKKLAGFTTTDTTYTETDEDGTETTTYLSYGQLPNLAKIRLMPILDENGTIQSGVVDATLTINSENGGKETVKLTGLSGQLAITTREMNPGVKYVPYSQLIQTNALKGSGQVKFEIVEGTLPSGLDLYPDGEIYGAPSPAIPGDFTFTVKAYFEGYEDEAVTRSFTITIADNTDENVYLATTNGDYQLVQPIGTSTGNYHYILDNLQDQIFISKGEYPQFVALWLDGVKLPASAYNAVSGSTVITVWGETIGDNDDGSGKTHTIAAEFREGGSERNGELKETSQNFVISLSASNPSDPSYPPNPSPSNSGTTQPGSGSSGSNTQKPSTSDSSNTPDNTTDTDLGSSTTPEAPAIPFIDVLSANWFYDDVKWAYDAGLVVGVTTTTFVPEEPISQATVVTLLARMAKVDLTQFDGITSQDIEPGQWYTNAAIWAKQSGLLPDYSTFMGTGPFSRSQMAVMLVKYLRSLGFDTGAPEDSFVFADADLMSADENNAFQVLYRYGIFKGVGNMYMDPAGVTTRAQFAALIHRISVFVQAQENMQNQ